MKEITLENKQRLFSFTMLVPLALMVLALSAYPIIYAIVLSFTDRGLFDTSMSFVWLDNFKTLLQNSEFWQSLKNTFAYTFWCTLITTLAGLGTAMLLAMKFKGNYYFRAVLTFPYLVPTIVAVSNGVSPLRRQFGCRWDLRTWRRCIGSAEALNQEPARLSTEVFHRSPSVAR